MKDRKNPLARLLLVYISSIKTTLVVFSLVAAQNVFALNVFQIYMNGVEGGERVRLLVGGEEVTNWTLTTYPQNYTTSTNKSGEVRVEFFNDGGSRDVFVDYLILNGTTYQAEAQATNTGVWGGYWVESCGGTNYSEWLHCDGYIGFGNIAPPVVVSSPSSSSSSIASSSSDATVSSVISTSSVATSGSVASSSASSSPASASSSSVSSSPIVSVTEAGAPLSISHIPLESGLTPPANVLIVTDDSGSMDWEVVVGQDSATKEESLEVLDSGSTRVLRYAYVFGRPINNIYGFPDRDGFDNYFYFFDKNTSPVAPLQSHINALSSSGYTSDLWQTMQGVWRLRNHNYNLIFYNPNVTYTPWPGYGSANPSAARVDPDVNQTVNLTSTSSTNMTWHIPQSNNTSVNAVSGTVYLPTYYKWNKSKDGNDHVGVDECLLVVEIKADAKYRDCDGNETGTGAYFPFPKPSGRTDCTGATCSYAEELQNFANWFTYYRRREFVAKASLSNVVNDVVGALEGIKVGYTTINADAPLDAGIYSSGVPIINVAKNSASDILDKIFKTKAGAGRTPLLTALDRSGRYFACDSGHIFSSLSSPNSTCPRNNSAIDDPKYASCQQNYTVMMTDGFWIGSSSDWSDAGAIITSKNSMRFNHDADGPTSPFDGGAFADSNLTGANKWLTLGDIAMYYYENDLAPAVDDKVQPTKVDLERIVDPTYWDLPNGQTRTMHQHMKTFTIGLGVFNDNAHPSIGGEDDWGNWIMPAPTDSVTWPQNLERDTTDSAKVDDLKHAAYNGRGQYYKGNDADMLSRNLRNVFKEIAQGAGAVGAVSFNSQRLSTDSVVYTASFNSRTNSGDVIAYNIDPDTGQISTAASNIVWKASEKLASQVTRDCTNETDSRNFLSFYRDGANSTGIEFKTGSVPYGDAQINWLRGHKKNEANSQCSNAIGFRGRSSDGLLGDIVHSRPLFIGAPTLDKEGGAYPSGTNAYSTFKASVSNRDPIVLVGANDGMLHGFDATYGTESFAYVPERLIQGGNGNNRVADLVDPSYSHQYFVDLSPAAEDVFVKTLKDPTRSWRTIAIGGNRAGGRGYFAIDVTNTSGFSGQGSGVDKIMWEFSDLDDPRLGYTFSPPLIAMTNLSYVSADQGNEWAAVFGNGYNSKDGVARLFLLDIEGGADGVWDASDYSTIAVGSTPTSGQAKNGLSIPRGIDIDGNKTLDYAYAGDLQGNVYRFDLTAPGSYSATKIFTAKDSGGKAQPITTQPMVIRHPEDNNSVVVVITTGSWMTQSDAESTDIQSVYGFVDTPANTVATPLNRSSLQVRYLMNVTAGLEVHRVIKGDPMDWVNYSGWYFDFAARAADIDPIADAGLYAASPVVNPGERAVRNMVTRGGYIFVNTIFPNQASSCDPVLGGAIMAFNPETGLVNKPIADFDQNGDFDTLNGENVAGVTTDNNLSDSAIIGDHLVVQQTDGQGVVTPSSYETNTAPSMRTGRLSWTQIK